MASFGAKEAAAIVHGAWVEGVPSGPLQSFSIDTRTLEKGQTFVAIRTPKRDGHAYLEIARDRKAQAAIVANPVKGIGLPQLVVENPLLALQSLGRIWRQRFKGPVVGITGSFGKTTVRELLWKAMGTQWFRTHGNLNNYLGVPLSLLELDVRRFAGGLIEAGINEPGEMQLLADLIDPDLAIITGVGPAHLEKLGTVEGVAREKAQLAHAVRSGGRVVLPATLLAYPEFNDISATVSVDAIAIEGWEHDFQTFGKVHKYLYRWDLPDGEGKRGRLVRADDSRVRFRFAAHSRGMVMNLALVVHTALTLGVPRESLQICLDGWRAYRQRGEVLRYANRQYYVDCYNANPASMLDSLECFEKLFAESRHLYVIGGMNELGSCAEEWHQQTVRKMPLKEGSCVAFVGPWAEAMQAALLERDWDAAKVSCHEVSESVRPLLEKFSGTVFLKGSRAYSLETLVEEGAVRC